MSADRWPSQRCGFLPYCLHSHGHCPGTVAAGLAVYHTPFLISSIQGGALPHLQTPDPCTPNPCMNGGQCNPYNDGKDFYCTCVLTDFVGDKCQVRGRLARVGVWNGPAIERDQEGNTCSVFAQHRPKLDPKPLKGLLRGPSTIVCLRRGTCALSFMLTLNDTKHICKCARPRPHRLTLNTCCLSVFLP